MSRSCASTAVGTAGGARWVRRLLLAAAVMVVAPVWAAGVAADDKADVGERIYRQGITGDGQPVLATRFSDITTRGRAAACVNCHRRSGFGGKEGLIIIPPVSANYLFFDPLHPSQEDLDLSYVDGMRLTRKPYTEETLARAIREGIGTDDKPLNSLMPRFALNQADMAALVAYLRKLDDRQTRGVTHNVLHFATIITPDADPVARQGVLDVLERFFADKNLAPVGALPRMHSSRKFHVMTNPHWQLHVWQLSGPADTWQKQLDEDLQREPVLAVISGVGGSNWTPVHKFCERAELPCLFPNVEAPPPSADSDFYSLYFSRGVYLEADLIAKRVVAEADGQPTRPIRQVYRPGDNGETAAKALAATLRGHGMTVDNVALSRGDSGKGVAAAVRQAAKGAGTLVLWLPPDDIASLGTPPADAPTVYLSGLLGGLDNMPLPAQWRSLVRVTYPFDLPERRRVNVDFAFGWFRIRSVKVVAPRVQADTYLACQILAGSIRRMVDTFVPEFLVERTEDMLDTRIITGYYPHLTLGQDQRFASKGGQIVRFDSSAKPRLIADGGWVVPQVEAGLNNRTATEEAAPTALAGK